MSFETASTLSQFLQYVAILAHRPVNRGVDVLLALRCHFPAKYLFDGLVRDDINPAYSGGGKRNKRVEIGSRRFTFMAAALSATQTSGDTPPQKVNR